MVYFLRRVSHLRTKDHWPKDVISFAFQDIKGSCIDDRMLNLKKERKKKIRGGGLDGEDKARQNNELGIHMQPHVHEVNACSLVGLANSQVSVV